VFLSRFIPLGGDEVPKVEWETSWECQHVVVAEGLTGMEHLQAWFTKRMETSLRQRGRRLIAWDEVLDAESAGDRRTERAADTAGGALARLPAGPAGHRGARRRAHSLYVALPRLPLERRLERIYAYDPAPPALAPERAIRVLGAQGSMWTGFQTARSEAGVETHVFPRLAGRKDYAGKVD
jgi:hexosaminidase